jgi:predicted outer membrane protein
MNARVDTRAFVFQKLLLRARSRIATILAVGAWAMSFSACRDRNRTERSPVAQSPTHDTAEVGGEVSPDTTAIAAATGSADTTTPGDDAVWITDANALAMLTAMNNRQIAMADVELEAWHSDTVRAFAASIAHDNAAIQHSLDSLAPRLKLAPVMSALGQRIDSEFQSRIDSLRYWRGPGRFERAYVHQQVLASQAFASYANQLTGATRAPEVQALMQSASARGATQASHARGVEAMLIIADSLKAAAIADSTEKAAERAAARERRRRPPVP